MKDHPTNLAQIGCAKTIFLSFLCFFLKTKQLVKFFDAEIDGNRGGNLCIKLLMISRQSSMSSGCCGSSLFRHSMAPSEKVKACYTYGVMGFLFSYLLIKKANNKAASKNLGKVFHSQALVC